MAIEKLIGEIAEKISANKEYIGALAITIPLIYFSIMRTEDRPTIFYSKKMEKED